MHSRASFVRQLMTSRCQNTQPSLFPSLRKGLVFWPLLRHQFPSPRQVHPFAIRPNNHTIWVQSRHHTENSTTTATEYHMEEATLDSALSHLAALGEWASENIIVPVYESFDSNDMINIDLCRTLRGPHRENMSRASRIAQGEKTDRQFQFEVRHYLP
jgi:hypothetical protein